MKKLIALFGLIVVALGSGCFERPGARSETGTGPLLRYHFPGTLQLAQNTNDPQLQKIAASPVSTALRREVVQKLANAPAQFWQGQLPPGTSDQAGLFQPLLEDLFSAESCAEVRGPAQRPQLVLAVALNENRARIWSTNLWQIATAWGLGAPRATDLAGNNGWEVAKPGAVLQFAQAGKWIVLGVGHETAGLLAPALKQISTGASPVPTAKNVLMEFDADFPRLGGLFPAVTSYRLPAVHLTVSNRLDSLRTEARLTYAEKIPWSREAWKIPTNQISGPINSFTVGRGVAPLLSQLRGVSHLKLKSYPDQFCAWAHSYVQGPITVTMPMPHAAREMNGISKGLPEMLKSWFNNPMGEFLFVSNRSEFYWTSIPAVAPFARPVTNAGIEYLEFGMLPIPPKDPPPPELLAAFIDRTNLLYWDFEITGERLMHCDGYYQLADILSNRAAVSTNLPSQNWLISIAPMLGETVTEVTLTAPNELFLVRKSHVGFTGFKLATLVHWIESPGFPFHFAPSTKYYPSPKPGAAKPPNTNNPPPGNPR